MITFLFPIRFYPLYLFLTFSFLQCLDAPFIFFFFHFDVTYYPVVFFFDPFFFCHMDWGSPFGVKRDIPCAI